MTKGKYLTLANKKKPLKKQKIRNAEYYDMQTAFDKLYADSVSGRQFRNLVELIQRPENIMLAYRNLRKNSGSKTAGVDKKTISDLNKWSDKKLINYVQRKLDWYVPNAVRRVEIPKDNGKKRPLGIPTIMDRLIQQCILQVLEPICEAKFFKRSNGFRPTHSAENAIAQAERMIQNIGCYYVIDIDIHGFFDNVNHGKLLKQMWALGIRDKKLAGLNLAVMNHLMNTPAGQRSVEYNDNRIALYVAQKGKCAVSGIALDANQVDCHHKKPLSLGGDDSYQNLIIVSDAVHVLIHSSSERTIKKYLNDLQLNSKQLAKLNNLRKLAEMPQITL